MFNIKKASDSWAIRGFLIAIVIKNYKSVSQLND